MSTLIPKFDLKNGGATPTGAVNRSIDEKLTDIISVKDFGATGDGVTDDSGAIQAAINSAKSVYFPPGIYLVNTQVNLSQDRCKLWGVNGETIMLAAGNNAIFGANSAFSAAVVEISGFVFKGNVAGQGTGIFSPTGATPYYLSWYHIHDCSFEKSLAFGINGILISSNITDCNFGLFGVGPNFQAIKSIGTASPEFSSNITSIRNCEFAYTSGVASCVEFEYGFKIILDTCIFEQNNVSGSIILFTGEGYPVVNNCWFELNTCSSLIKISPTVNIETIVLTLTNNNFNTSTTPSLAIIDFDTTSNRNLVFNQNLIALGNCPLANPTANLLSFVGNYSTNIGIVAAAAGPAIFDSGVTVNNTVKANLFQSVANTTPVANTPVAVYTFPTYTYPSTSGVALYLVSGNVTRDAAGDYSAFAVIATDTTTGRVIQNSTQAGITLSLSGLVLSAVTNSATPLNVDISIIRIG